jgi:hypothetical protein
LFSFLAEASISGVKFWAPDRSYGLVCISTGTNDEYGDNEASVILPEVLQRMHKYFCK